MHWVSFSPRFSCGRFQKRVRKHSRNPRRSTRRRTERWVLRLPQEVISPGPGEEEGMGSCFSSKIFATENLERASSRVVLSTLLGRPGGAARDGVPTERLCHWHALCLDRGLPERHSKRMLEGRDSSHVPDATATEVLRRGAKKAKLSAGTQACSHKLKRIMVKYQGR